MILSQTYPKAKKKYHCDWCWEWINIGDKHVKTACIFDGDFQSHRMHYECNHACQNDSDRDSGFDRGAMKRPVVTFS